MRVLIAVTVSGLLLAQVKPRVWPVVKPVHTQITVTEQAGRDAPVHLVVTDVRGRPLYTLDCHNSEYDDDFDLSYSGDFQCALFVLTNGKTTSGNLLADSSYNASSTDWWNRGRMLAKNLWRNCANYPEYGTLRHFKVRGMLVTLRFGDLVWATPTADSSKLSRFTADIDVAPDRRATSPTAEYLPGPTPGQACDWY
jgi:hypothetical protein